MSKSGVGVRRKKVEEFMARLSPGMRNNVRLTTLDTPYGSTVVERDVEAVVLSSETVRGGQEKNHGQGVESKGL